MPLHDPADMPREFNPLAGILAWLWPGAGHILVHGERSRGFAIMAGMLFLIVCGVLIGGIDCVDRVEDRLWFLAQAPNGPIAFGLDFLNQNWIKKMPPDDLLRTTGLGRVNEMGTLFIALAGLMNLVVIIDAMSFKPPRRVERRREVRDA